MCHEFTPDNMDTVLNGMKLLLDQQLDDRFNRYESINVPLVSGGGGGGKTAFSLRRSEFQACEKVTPEVVEVAAVKGHPAASCAVSGWV